MRRGILPGAFSCGEGNLYSKGWSMGLRKDWELNYSWPCLLTWLVTYEVTTFFQWKWIRHKGVWEAEEKCQKSLQKVTLQLVLNASFVWVLDWAGMNYDKYKMILVFSCRVFSTQLFKRKKNNLEAEKKTPKTNKQKNPSSNVTKITEVDP